MLDGKLQPPSNQWLKEHNYLEEETCKAETTIQLQFTHAEDPIFVDDAEHSIIQHLCNYDNSILIQKTQQYFNDDISLIQCFWGENIQHFQAVQTALNINSTFTHPKEWIFVEAQKSEQKCKFKDICAKIGIKYKFIKIHKQSEGIFLKTALWNIGFKMSTQKKLAFLDADIVFCKYDWLKSVSNELDNADVISLHSKSYYAKQTFYGDDSALEGFKRISLSRGYAIKNRLKTIEHSGFSIGMTRKFFTDYFKQFDVIPSKYEDLLYWYKITGEKTERTPYTYVYQYNKIKDDLKVGYGEAICCHICHGQISARNYEYQLSLKNFRYNSKHVLPYYRQQNKLLVAAKNLANRISNKKCNIDWSIFDKIYCIHYLPYKDRLEQTKRELAFAGILDLPQFQFYYTSPNPYYNLMLKDSTPDCQETVYIGNVNLQVNRLNLFLEAKLLGFKRILIIEDDIIFSNDIHHIEECIANFPLDYDIVNMDPYVVLHDNVMKEVNKLYYEPKTATYNCSFISFTSKAIDNVIEAMSSMKSLVPSDNIKAYVKPDVKYCICSKNICIQHEFQQRQNLFIETDSKYLQLDLDDYQSKSVKTNIKNNLRFEIDITRECNWNCSSCNRLCNIRKRNKSSYMTLSEVKSVVKQIKKASKHYKIDKLKILGGEPTIHPQFKEICQIVKNELFDVIQNHNIIVGTNGSNNSQYKDFILKEMQFKILGDEKTLSFKNEEHRNTLLSPTETKQKLVCLPCHIFYDCGIGAFKVDGKIRWYWCNVGSILAQLAKRDVLKKSLKELLSSSKESLYSICKHCQCAAVSSIKYSDDNTVSNIFAEGLKDYAKRD